MMIEKTISRLMLFYFLVYFGIAVGQFLLFSFMHDIGAAFFLAAMLWIALLLMAAEKVPVQKAWIVFSLFGLLIKTLWIVFVPTPAISDYALMYNAAREIMDGTRSYLDNIYFERFPYQLGFTAYQALVLSAVDSVTFLKLVNALWCTAASVAVYAIAREAFSQKVAVLALLLHVTLLPVLMLSSVLTNQHIAVAWLYAGIYLWMKSGVKSWPWALAAGAVLAVGNIMRPIGIVVIAAIVVNELIRLIRRPSGFTAQGILRAGAAVAVYFLVIHAASVLLSQTGISPDGLRNNDPLWKFVAGLNAAANGSYSTGDEALLNYGYLETGKRTALEKEIIMERLTSPRNMVTLPFMKIGKLWADYQPYWFTFPKKEGTTFNYLGWPVSFDDAIGRYRNFERAVFYLLALPAFWGILRVVRTGFSDDRKRLLVLILGAYTFVHLLVEVQPRYLYFLFGIVAAFSASELLSVKTGLGIRTRNLLSTYASKQK